MYGISQFSRFLIIVQISALTGSLSLIQLRNPVSSETNCIKKCVPIISAQFNGMYEHRNSYLQDGLKATPEIAT